MGRRTRTAVIVGVTVVLALGVGGALVLVPDGKDKVTATAKDQAGATAPIVQGDLTVTADVGGTLGYAATGSIYAQAPDPGQNRNQPDNGATPPPLSGGKPPGGPSKDDRKQNEDDQDGGTRIFTQLPKVGDTVKQGESAYQVNGRPVTLFYGEAPLWRALSKGVTDGVDVRLLKWNLVALGFGKDLRVDDKFTDGTTAAVKRWQKSRGVPQTGRVDPSAVVVQPAAVRVASVKASIGAPAQGEVAEVSGTGRQVTVPLPIDKQTLAKQGDKLTVRLPGGKATTGTISSIGTVAEKGENQNGGPGGGGTPTIKVVVTLDTPEEAGTLDSAPVTVGFTSQSRKGVLSVPVNALVALAEGGYAVEVVDGTGNKRLVGVEPGLFANGRVEITGEGLAKDQKVRVPGS
ncbi:peptidoglycan-binding protein [Kitasatospora sp. NPDC059795]|uniref:peptidoglycan-binding protein n=1 Tax=Kitasatospora sp. NPDC059795 TaxID=3346949 RepID=UPI0036627D9A